MRHEVDQVYYSFLVRCWLMPRTVNSEPVVWRFELREVTAEPDIHRFANLKALNAFLAGKLTSLAGSGDQAVADE